LVRIQRSRLDRRIGLQRRRVLSQLTQSRLRNPGIGEENVFALLNKLAGLFDIRIYPYFLAFRRFGTVRLLSFM